jgi:hypothetical protein
MNLLKNVLQSHFLLESIRDYSPVIDQFQLLTCYAADVIIYEVLATAIYNITIIA